MLARRIPLWVKLAYTAFLAVLIPIYLRDYGPTNFLYFCDVALLMTLVAVWIESPLLASAALVGILVVQLIWMTDFMAVALGGRFVDMTNYMFDARKEFFLRFLSFFHFWLPWFLVWIVYRLGYDRRAWLTWSLIAWPLITVCYFFMPPAQVSLDPNLPVNINYVYGMNDAKPQEWMHPHLWYLMEMFGMPFLIWWPTHWVLKQLFRPPGSQTSPQAGPPANDAATADLPQRGRLSE